MPDTAILNALALGVIAPAEAETALLTAFSDSDEDVRNFAADALGDVRTAAVMQAIETRLAAETSPVVRSAPLSAKNKLDRRVAVDSWYPIDATR